MSLHLIVDVLKNAALVTGLVMVMMMTIEYVNVRSAGKWFASLRGSRTRQVFLGALLGLIPGCVGGFAAVSLFSHGLISLGALVAAMIASSGDEAFVMLAMIPKTALVLFGVLLAVAAVSGLLVDRFYKKPLQISCEQEFEVHYEHVHDVKPGRSFKVTKEKAIIAAGLLVFALALFSGQLEHSHDHLHAGGAGHIDEHTAVHDHSAHHDHSAVHDHSVHHNHSAVHDHSAHLEHAAANGDHTQNHHGAFPIFNERWINLLFAAISVAVLLMTLLSNEHFVKEHLWNHVVRKHCHSIFLWTFGALAVIQIGLQYVDIEPWIENNLFVVILTAALVGMIPESGPHMIFITLFAGGYIPFSVLLASSISQDGHTALPLLASDKGNFVKTKIINALIAIVIGGILMLLGL